MRVFLLAAALAVAVVRTAAECREYRVGRLGTNTPFGHRREQLAQQRMTWQPGAKHGLRVQNGWQPSNADALAVPAA
jgi:hypothetical protein